MVEHSPKIFANEEDANTTTTTLDGCVHTDSFDCYLPSELLVHHGQHACEQFIVGSAVRHMSSQSRKTSVEFATGSGAKRLS